MALIDMETTLSTTYDYHDYPTTSESISEASLALTPTGPIHFSE